MSLAFDLDHVAVVVDDLDAAETAYTKLGFRLTPRSSHRGPLPDGTVGLWGSGNHCAMFRRGYLEVLGITDRRLRHEHVAARLARYVGLHLIAFGTADVDAAVAALRAKGVPGVEDAVEVGRAVPFGSGTKRGSFGIAHLDAQTYPEADFLLIEHKTRDVLWQLELLPQPNGVVGLRSATLAVESPADTLDRLAPLLGPVQDSGFDLAAGRLDIVAADEMERRFPGMGRVQPLPKGVAVAFDVADPAATARWLRDAGVAFTAVGPDRLRVAPAEAAGAIVDFVAPA